MLTKTPAFLAAQASAEQTPIFRVVINFPSPVASYQQDVSDCVVSIKPTRSVTTALPEQATLIAGLSSADIEITLAGMLPQALGVALDESDTVDKLFRPNDASADLYRQAKTGLTVTVDQGFYVSGGTTPEYCRVGTYTVDTPEVGDGYVILTCRDGMSYALSGAATLPPVVTQAPQNAALTSEWPIDHMLRSTKYLSWPALHPNCLLAVSFRSSIWPEVGTLYPGFAQSPVFSSSRYGTGLGKVPALVVYSLAAPLLTTDKICGHFLSANGGMSLTVNDDPATYQISIQRSVPAGTSVFIHVVSPSGDISMSVPVIGGFHEIEFSLSWPAGSTSVTGSLWIDGIGGAITPITAADARPAGRSFTLASAGGPLEGVQITNEPAYTSRAPFVATLFLDPSLNPLVALPDVSGKTISAVVQEACEAEAAVFLIDESDVAHFVNRETIRAKTSVATITSTDDLSQLTTQEQKSMLATHVQVAYTPLQIQPYGQAWASTDGTLVVAAGATITVTAKANILSLGTTMVILPNGGALTSGQSGYRAAHRIDGSGGAISNLVFTITQTSNVDITITIMNPNGFPAHLVSPTGAGFPPGSDGQPMLFLGGQAVVSAGTVGDGTTTTASGTYADSQWPPVSAGGAAGNPAGDILYSVPANDWRQDRDAAQALADHLLSDLAHIKPLYRNLTIKPNSALQLLDVTSLSDTDVSQTFEDVLLLGIMPVYSDGDFAMAINAIAKAPSGAWLLGIAGKSELGITTYAH